jgi:hypothetical protein
MTFMEFFNQDPPSYGHNRPLFSDMASWAISIQNGGKSSIYVPSPSLMPARQMVSINPTIKKQQQFILGEVIPRYLPKKSPKMVGFIASFLLTSGYLTACHGKSPCLTGNSALLSSFIIYDITIYNTHIDGLFSIAVLFFRGNSPFKAIYGWGFLRKTFLVLNPYPILGVF